MLTFGRMIGNWKRAAKLTSSDWRFLAIAAGELALARLRHAVQPAATILAQLQNTPLQACGASEPSKSADLRRMSWAIGAASARVPWRADCLLQAMAADRWMRRNKLRPSFHLGVRKDGRGNLLSHAWIRHGGLTITGGGDDEFQVVIGRNLNSP